METDLSLTAVVPVQDGTYQARLVESLHDGPTLTLRFVDCVLRPIVMPACRYCIARGAQLPRNVDKSRIGDLYEHGKA